MSSSLYTSFVVSFLQENYPSIYEEINKNFNSDLSELDKIATYFCSYHQIEIRDIQRVRVGKFLKLKYKFIASVLYLFQPNKLTNTARLNKEIAVKLREILLLDSIKLKRYITASTNLYLYKDFKTDVLHFCSTYKLLK